VTLTCRPPFTLRKFLVFISVDPRAMVRLEVISELKISSDSIGMETVAFRLVV
jgi:hypothetical protein